MFSLKWSVSVPFLGKATKGGTLTDGECLFMNRLLNILEIPKESDPLLLLRT